MSTAIFDHMKTRKRKPGQPFEFVVMHVKTSCPSPRFDTYWKAIKYLIDNSYGLPLNKCGLVLFQVFADASRKPRRINVYAAEWEIEYNFLRSIAQDELE